MKPSQKLVVQFENIKVIVRFEDLDAKLLPIAQKLERTGNRFPASNGVYDLVDGYFVGINYNGCIKDAVPEAKIFGYPEKEFLARQYK